MRHTIPWPVSVLGLVLCVFPFGCASREVAGMTDGLMEEVRPRTVRVDFQYIDKSTCDRCIGSDANLDRAVGIVMPVLHEIGADLEVHKTLVESESQAQQLGFVTSPTILVDGYDIAGELCESDCKACGDASGCESGIDCRVWRYRGEEHTQAPVGVIVEAILGALHGQHRGTRPQPGGPVGENLKRFFSGREAQRSAGCCSSSSGCR